MPAAWLCLAFILAWAELAAAQQTLFLTGKVVDENGAAVAAALITIEAMGVPAPLKATTDEAGRFSIAIPAAVVAIKVERVGYYAYTHPAFAVSDKTVEIALNHQQEYEETVTVVYSVPTIDPGQTAVQKTITAEEIQDLPSTSTHDFRNNLPMIPGVVKDNKGRIHLNGGGENQALYTLDGFNITSPSTGTMENRLSVDSIRAINVETSRYSAEFGKGSAGVMGLETSTGDDHFRYSSTNFVPSFQVQDGGLYLSNWNPRFSVSGPIVKKRAWFFNALDLQYDMNLIRGLPKGENQSKTWLGGDLIRLQFSLTNTNLFSAGFLMNFDNVDHGGLGPLDPISTTRDRRNRFYLITLKDEAYLHGGWVVESGLALNRIETKARPLGHETYVYSPKGRSGNYFLSSSGDTERLQGLVNVLSPSWNWHGRHTVKFGVNADKIHYRQYARRHETDFLRLDGTLSRRGLFSGPPSLKIKNAEFSGYAQDRWAATDRVMVEAGVRWDWDQIVRQNILSPRLAVSWSPVASKDMKLSGGVGLFFDATSMPLLGQALGEQRTDLFFAPDGTAPVGDPSQTKFTAYPDYLRAQHSINWSLGWEQKLPRSFYLRTTFMAKEGYQGWSYNPVVPPGMPPSEYSGGTLALRSARRDKYRYGEITVTKSFLGRYPWLVSYARSSARSNQVLEFSLDNPIYGLQQNGPLDWDTPNRVISWGVLPLPKWKKYTLAFFLEWRTGFPYSAVNDRQQLTGIANSYRFPDYFSANLHMERRFLFWRYQWAFRAGFNNLTSHQNPDTVNNNVAAPDFGAFSGGPGCTFTGRIRLLGKR
jgi:hypothetical protein